MLKLWPNQSVIKNDDTTWPRHKSMNTKFITIVKIVSVLIFIVIVINATPAFKNALTYIEQTGNNATQLPPVKVPIECDISSSDCLVKINDQQEIAFSLRGGITNSSAITDVADTNASDFPPIHDNNLTATVNGLTPASIELKVEGRDMFMGIIHREFTQKSESDFIIEKLVLPACTSNPDMIWLFTITIVNNDLKYTVEIELASPPQ